MIDHIFSVPIYKTQMPNHQKVLTEFSPFFDNEEIFQKSTHWDCDCNTSHNNAESNVILPWHTFFNGVKPLFEHYLKEIGLNNTRTTTAFAWANTYNKGQHQEVHAHSNGRNVISCAYMLHTPRDPGQFIFYKSGMDFFQRTLLDNTEGSTQFGNRYNPDLVEGEIVFFPSNLDHYVTYNRTDSLRVTISANFSLSF
jgi:hypothetical protein